MDEAIIQQTQGLYGPLIKKPKMSDKLLKKPPFRFLHDVFSELTRATGFAEGLFQGGELDAGSIKDKESKIGYLQKMLDYTNAACGQNIPVKLGKVVAGLEPENTNAFLQKVAECATDPSVDRNAALAAALGLPAANEDNGAADREAAEQAAAEQAAAEQQAAAQRAAAEEENRRREDEERRAREIEQMQQQQAEDEQARFEQQQQEEALRQQQEEEAARQAAAAQAAAQPPAPPPAQPPQPEPAAAEHYAPPQPQHPDPHQGGYQGEPSNEMIPPQRKAIPARPTTARRAPPKLPSKEVKVTNRGPKEGYMDGAGEQQSAGIAVGLITEDDDTQDEEFDMAAEEAITGFSGISGWDKEQTEDVTVDEDGVHGKLVGDILAEKKKLQEETQQKPPEPAPEQHQGIVITKKRRSSVETNTRPAAAAPKPSKQSENDVAHLREEIQTLCQSTNPLGKCIEFIQEDLENMEKEYSMWKSDSQKYSMKLDAQADNTESSLVPLQQELADEVEKVANLTSQINRIKASIMHNDATIHNLLRGVVGTNPQ